MPSKPEIRIMLPADLEAVVNFWLSIEGIGMSPDDNPADLCTYLIHNPGLSFVAFDQGELVGAVLCGQDGRRGYINHLAVASTYRRRGLGEALVDRCLEALLMLGIKKCHIFVFQNNHPAIAFWGRTGWEQRSDLIVMSRRI